MKRWFAALCALALSATAFADAKPAQNPIKTLKVVSEYWPGHTNLDGSGLAFELLRRVFEPSGYAVRTQNMPYTRSVGLVQRGEADAFVGSYYLEVPDVLYPHWSYDKDEIYALGLADQPPLTLDTVNQYRLGWARGYSYQKYLPKAHDFREIYRRGGILGMLDKHHIDYFIDASSEVAAVLKSSEQPERYRAEFLIGLPLYIGFVNSPRGRELAELYDKRMTELIKSSALKAIFTRWDQPYPFDQDKERR